MRNNASNARFATAATVADFLGDGEPGFLDKGRAAGFDRYAQRRAFKDRDNKRRSDRLSRRDGHDDNSED